MPQLHEQRRLTQQTLLQLPRLPRPDYLQLQQHQHKTKDANTALLQKEQTQNKTASGEDASPQKTEHQQATTHRVGQSTANLSDPQKDTENEETPPPFCRECIDIGGICQVDSQTKANKLGYLHLQVGGFHIKALVDTGASVSVMSQELANQIWVCDPDSIIWRSNPKPDTTITLADGKKVPVLEKMQLQMQIFDEDVQETLHILQETHTTILGWPFFANNDLTIDCKRRLLIRENCTFQINSIEITQEAASPRTMLRLLLEQDTTLPAGRQEYPYCKLTEQGPKYKQVTGVVEPSSTQKGTKEMDEYAVGHALVTLNHEGGCHIILSNISEETKTFTKGTEIAQFTIMNSNDYNEIKQVHPIAAECIAAVAPHVNMGKQDFSIVTRLAQETDKTTNAQMDKTS